MQDIGVGNIYGNASCSSDFKAGLYQKIYILSLILFINKMSYIEIENNNTSTSLNNISIQSGTPVSGQALVYNSTNNQWVFDTISGGPTGPTGPAGGGGSSSPATSTSLGTVQLAGDLSGTAIAPVIKTYEPNMLSNVSLYTVLGQDTRTGNTASVPISYSTSGTIGEFQFTQLILTSGRVGIGLKSTTTNFTAYGTGYVSRLGSNVPTQLATLNGVTITTSYNSLVGSSTPVVDGCDLNESEKWQIFLKNASGRTYCLDIYFFNNLSVDPPIFAALYGIS